MINTVFLCVAIAATAIFLIQFIMSVFFGDLDTDTDIDADLGSVLSFKGFTHFCMGMGWYMYLSKQADMLSYGIGIVVGIAFVGILWYLYKKAYQLQKENKPEKPEALLGRTCTIYSQSGDHYVVQIAINGALREMEVRSLAIKSYRTGDKTTICKIELGTMYIQ